MAVNYQQDGLDKRVIFDFGTYLFDTTDVSESFTHTQIVNPTGDFVIGVASTAQLTFNLNNVYRLIPDNAIAGKKFIYKAGAQASAVSKKDLFKKIRKDIVCIDTVAYAGNLKAPYLTIWGLDGVQLPAPAQPAQPVKSLFIVDGKLYCGHDNAPYLTAYTVTGDTLAKLADVVLNPFQISKIELYNKRSKSFYMAGDIYKEFVKTDKTELIDGNMQTTLIDFEENTFEFTQIGVFIAEKPERKNDITISVTAYDCMDKFSAVIDTWNNTIKYPITAGAMLKSLCDFVKVPLATPMFLNSDYIIQRNYKGENVTGKQVVQWIAQLAACFAMMDSRGGLTIRRYEDKGYTIDESSYTDVTIAEYETKRIDKLQIKVTETDIGVIVPKDAATTNALIIENNPLLYAETDAELRPTAQKIFDAIKNMSYAPYSIKTIWGDPRRCAGDIMTIKTLKGQIIKGPVMSLKTTGVRALRGDYTATGAQIRETKVDAVNQQIQQVRGSVHEVVNTVEEFRSTVTKYQEKTDKTLETHQTEILQNSEQIDLRATKTEVSAIDKRVKTAEGTIKVNSEQIDLRATKTEVSAIDKRVKTAEGTIKVNSENIELKVAKKDYTGKEITSLINLTTDKILIKSARVDIQGYLTAGDASFRSKIGDREIQILDAEIQVKRNGVTVGQIWANKDRTGMGIEYLKTLWISRTTSDGSSRVMAFGSDGEAYFDTTIYCVGKAKFKSDVQLYKGLNVNYGLTEVKNLNILGDLKTGVTFETARKGKTDNIVFKGGDGENWVMEVINGIIVETRKS